MPGCYNFDPLGLYGLIGADASGRKGMRELETAHGRFAMVAISVWAFLEPMTQASSARRAPRASRLAERPRRSRTLAAVPTTRRTGTGRAISSRLSDSSRGTRSARALVEAVPRVG